MFDYMRMFCNIWGVGIVMAGIVTLIGGAARWNTATYAILALVPGNPWTWGAVLVTLGLLLLIFSMTNKPLHLSIVNAVCAITFLMFASGVLMAALVSVHAAFVGAVWFSVLSTQFFALGKISYVEHKKRKALELTRRYFELT